MYMLNDEEENRYLNLQVLTTSFIQDNMITFDNGILYFFPVLDGTKYAKGYYTLPPKALLHFVHSRGIDWNKSCTYNVNCRTLFNRHLTKGMFKQHSLYLLKESLKTFSPYSKEAKELLNKLEALE